LRGVNVSIVSLFCRKAAAGRPVPLPRHARIAPAPATTGDVDEEDTTMAFLPSYPYDSVCARATVVDDV
jgi:hypothetical protein